MYRKKLFLESVHKLGLGTAKENAVISLFEATLDSNDNDELNMLDDENPSDNMDYLSGDVEEKPEGSAFNNTADKNDIHKNRAKLLIKELDGMLEPYRNVDGYTTTLGCTPNGTKVMIELISHLCNLGLGNAAHLMNDSMKTLMGAVTMFNSACNNEKKYSFGPLLKYEFNPMVSKAKSNKHAAITQIIKQIGLIDGYLNTIKKALGITVDTKNI